MLNSRASKQKKYKIKPTKNVEYKEDDTNYFLSFSLILLSFLIPAAFFSAIQCEKIQKRYP
jgi:hypothetical protein